jgi:hypothetical protein
MTNDQEWDDDSNGGLLVRRRRRFSVLASPLVIVLLGIGHSDRSQA